MTWPIVPLGDVAETALGKMLDRGKSRGLPHVPYLRNVNVQWGRIDTDDLLTMELADDERERFGVREGDLLVCEGGEVGRCAIWKGMARYIAFQKALHRVRPSDRLDSRYLRYLLEHHTSNGTLLRLSTGSTIAHLPQQQLRRVPVPLAPIDEQRRLVAVLEDNLSRLDAAGSDLAAASQRLDLMRRGVMQAAIRGDLSPRTGQAQDRTAHLASRAAHYPSEAQRGRPVPIPAAGSASVWPSHWLRLSLEEATHPVRTISYGILKPGPNIEDGVPYVRVVNMRNDEIAVDDLHRTTLEIAGRYARARLKHRDVLISIRGTFGRVALVPPALEGGNITQDTARLAFVGEVLPEFAAIYLRSLEAQAYLKRVARGVAVKGVNIGDLRQMPFPLPPVEEQRLIIARVDELLTDVQATRSAVKSSQDRSLYLRRSLLAAAFRGDLTGNREVSSVV